MCVIRMSAVDLHFAAEKREKAHNSLTNSTPERIEKGAFGYSFS